MTLQADVQIVDSNVQSDSYEPSVISSAATSQASIFSDDAASEQSSVASCSSDDFHDGRDKFCTSSQTSSIPAAVDTSSFVSKIQGQLSYADVTSVPPAQRQHPRRSSLARNQKPPLLVRQADRKLNFVDSLVDSATQMVEVIWPLSMVHCRVEGPHGRGVLPLRTYIEETLRRSRTSYSTLQVALYYLILIKPHVPKREEQADSQTSRALVCGRRMFLAALILASKYLQDRNYSAKAWSKMSGLKVTEINANERIFLAKIGWKLHVAKPVFDHWTEIVLKYTPSSHPPSPSADGIAIMSWKGLVPILTPELDGIPLPGRQVRAVTPPTSGFGFALPMTSTPTQDCYKMQIDSVSESTTPTPASVALPKFLEQRPTLLPPTPGLVRMGPLPTPQMTPSSVAASTPAASACNSRRPSICGAMSIAQRFGMSRCINDEFPFPSMDKFCHSRRQSVISLASARSSPESMITDMTRTSRASSISSATTMSTTSACPAPPRSSLARMATTRNVRMLNLADVKTEGSAANPITITEDEPTMPDFAINEKKLHAPHRHSKHAPQHVVHSTTEKSRKRHRQSRGGRKSDLYDEVRYQLEEDADDAMSVDTVTSSDEDMKSPSPAASHASSMLRRSETAFQMKESQPPALLSRSLSGRIPLSRHDGSKRTCYSADNTFVTTFRGASLYMETA